MPREDDDALGQMLGDRLQGTKGKSEDDEVDDTETSGDESEAKSASGPNGIESATQESTESTQITQSTDSTDTTNTTLEGPKKDTKSESRSTEGTVRSRSPFPLYVTPELKETVQNRFEKFNAQRTLNDEPQVEKHKHFMEGLLRAGLEHPDLEEYVLNEFDDS